MVKPNGEANALAGFNFGLMDKTKPQWLNALLLSETRIRIIWLVLAYFLLIFIGEIGIVDPAGWLLEQLGLSTHIAGDFPVGWNSAAGAGIKRILRILVIIVSTILVLKGLNKNKLSQFGFGPGRSSSLLLLSGILLGFLIEIVSIGLMGIFGYYEITGLSWKYTGWSMLGAALLYSIIYSLETGIIEEVIFRGFLISLISERFSVRLGVITSSLLFGILHFTGFENEFPWWASILTAGIAGLIFAQAYLLFNNVWLPAGIHMAIHLASRLLGTVGLAENNALLLITHIDGPVLLVPTRSGGASLFELIGFGVVSLILLYLRKRKG